MSRLIHFASTDPIPVTDIFRSILMYAVWAEVVGVLAAWLKVRRTDAWQGRPREEGSIRMLSRYIAGITALVVAWGNSCQRFGVHRVETMTPPPSLLPDKIWPAFAVFAGVGAALGLLGGADLLPEIAFGIGLFLVPAVFIVWAVARLGLERLARITGSGHDAT